MKKHAPQIALVMLILLVTLSGCGWLRTESVVNAPDNSDNYDRWHDQNDANQEAPSSGMAIDEPAEEYSFQPTNSRELEAGQAEPSSAGGGSGPVAPSAQDSSYSAEKDPMEVQPPHGNPPPWDDDEDEPDDMFFEDYGTNPFIDTEEDNLSTFATDVDTGSYTIARNYINQGIRPPEDAIRVEEFINFFPQGYKMPSERETFRITIDGGPTPFTERDSYSVIRIGIQGYDVPERERKDAALTFVIDVSGSMGNGRRLEMVQDSLELLVDQLTKDDTVAIVAYTDTAWVVLPPTSARQKDKIVDAIYELYPMASTNAEAGLILGYEVASQAYIRNGINRVILCSDGVANVGATGPDSIWESIQDYASEGINLTSIGVGMGNYNDVLMEQLADQGNGFYAYVDSMEEANRLFVDDLVSILQVIAYDAKVQVVFNPEVVSHYRLIGFENRAIADEDFRNNSVDAAEIGAGHSVTALYEIKTYAGERGEIATVQFRWQDPDDYKVHEISETFDTRDLENSFRRADPYFQADVLVAEFAEILRDSPWAEHSTIWELIDYAEDIADQIERSEFYEFVDLLEQASYLD
ncbi:MAG: vWA domain-containing protein [Anaerolineales bacterium]